MKYYFSRKGFPWPTTYPLQSKLDLSYDSFRAQFFISKQAPQFLIIEFVYICGPCLSPQLDRNNILRADAVSDLHMVLESKTLSVFGEVNAVSLSRPSGESFMCQISKYSAVYIA